MTGWRDCLVPGGDVDGAVGVVLGGSPFPEKSWTLQLAGVLGEDPDLRSLRRDPWIVNETGKGGRLPVRMENMTGRLGTGRVERENHDVNRVLEVKK